MNRFFFTICILTSFQCKNSIENSSGVDNDSLSTSSISIEDRNSNHVAVKSAGPKKQIDTVVLINDTVSIIIDSLKMDIQAGVDPTDNDKCGKWMLDSSQVVNVIRKCVPISTYYLHYGYSVQPCSLSGNVVIGSKKYKIEINGGSYFYLYSADTSYIFGDEENRLKRYFISGTVYDENN